MNAFRFLYVISGLFLFILSCNSGEAKKNEDTVSKISDNNLSGNVASENTSIDSVQGDYNGDGKTEYMWLVPPKIMENDMSCEGNCTSIIQFSDKNIPSIKVEDCINGFPVNEGDLNGNGTDEIGLLPGWFTSC